MATVSLPLTSFTDSASAPYFKKRVISNAVELIDPIDTPLLDAIGGLNGGAGIFSFTNPPSTKIEWIKDTYIPITTTITEPIAAVDTASITLADGNLVQAGDYLKIGSEYLWVSAVSDNVATVTRGFMGSTPATAADNAAVEIISMARLEGAEATYRGSTVPTVDYNYSQIFEQGLRRTGSQQLVSYEGIQDWWSYEANKRMPEMLRKIEKALLTQTRVADADFVIGKARHFGGINQYITTNAKTAADLDATSQVLDLDMIEDLVQLPWGYGATGSFLGMVHPNDFKFIKRLYDAEDWIRTDPSQTNWGFTVHSTITAFGDINWVMNRYLPEKTMYLLKPEYMGLIELRPFAIRDLPATGDYEANDMVGEYTFALSHEKYMAKLTGYTFS